MRRVWFASSAMVSMLANAAAPLALGSQEGVDHRDSAGVAIVTSRGALAERSSGWTLDTLPDLQIGVVTGEPAYEFSRITGIGALANGEVVVVDGASAELRFFDARGRFVRRVGRRGRGPGEFENPYLVPAIRYDSIRIMDARLRRLTIFGIDGTLAGTTRPFARTSGSAAGHLGGGRLAFGSPIPLFQVTRARIIPWTSSVRILSTATGSIDTIAAFPMAMIGALLPNGMGSQTAPPFTVRPSVTVGDQALFLTSGTEPEIRKYDRTGRLTALFRVDMARVPVDREEFVDLINQRFRVVDPLQRARLVRDAPMPTSLPVFDALIADAAGFIWARSHTRDTTRFASWVVFAPDGAVVGTISMPVELEIEHIEREFVLGRWRDADRVEYVRRHRLRRSAR